MRQFALSDGVEIMVMTLAAFNKAGNVIHQTTDRLQGETPVHLVQAARPVLVLDEPQNMESEKSIAALAVLNPLFALRYSATHRNPYNIDRLSSQLKGVTLIRRTGGIGQLFPGAGLRGAIQL